MSHHNEVRHVSTRLHIHRFRPWAPVRLPGAGAAARVLEGIEGDRVGSGWRQSAARQAQDTVGLWLAPSGECVATVRSVGAVSVRACVRPGPSQNDPR
eukprot:scaffold18909_cov37-Phaeocystis_antarctica.AAC.2